MTNAPRLLASAVSKTFGRARVLNDVSLTVEAGEIHSLIGQNGSGKSTLIKILTGYHAPDAGAHVEIDGTPLHLPVNWNAAQQLGLSVVHQDLGLIDELTVSENIGIGGFVGARGLGKISWKKQDRLAAKILERLEIPVSPRARVGELSASRRAAIGIARALRDQSPGSGLMILDEATRALPKDELVKFHELVRRVAAAGTSVLMVSHSLEEVLSLSDRVTVLRDGSVVGAGLLVRDLSELDLAKLMLDRTVERLVARPVKTGRRVVAARIEGLTVPGHEPISIEVAKGEVVGVTGLPGTGFEQIPSLIAAARNPVAGSITTETGTIDLRRASVSQLMRTGVVMVPESRLKEGLTAELSVRDNIALPNLRRRGKSWFVSSRWQDQLAGELIERLKIKTRSGAALLKELSGGNQQKVLLAKWLSVDPELLILHEPTQAVDVGARVDLLRAIGEAADRGMGVLLVSAEPSDLVEACDRILVVNPGRPVRELLGVNEDAVLDAMYDVAQEVEMTR